MTSHDITNKMAAIVAHLRMADTLSASAGSIDHIRKAMEIALSVGEESGKSINKEGE